MLRVVDENVAIQEARKLLASGEPGWAMTQFQAWLRGQPTQAQSPAREEPIPPLVGAKGAAEILGIHPPHVTRYRQDGRLAAITVYGGNDVFIRAQVEALAREIRDKKR